MEDELLLPPLITVYARLLDGVTLLPVTSFQRVVPLTTPLPSGSTPNTTLGVTATYTLQLDGYQGLPVLNYGLLNAVLGGDSQYIIEFDIWNNEPAFSADFLPLGVSDAVNLSLLVQDSTVLTSLQNVAPQLVSNQPGTPVVYGRCVTAGPTNPWVPFTNGTQSFSALYGDVNPTQLGFLAGNAPGGDHTVVQTKVTLQPNTPNGSYNFVVGVNYSYYSTYSANNGV